MGSTESKPSETPIQILVAPSSAPASSKKLTSAVQQKGNDSSTPPQRPATQLEQSPPPPTGRFTAPPVSQPSSTTEAAPVTTIAAARAAQQQQQQQVHAPPLSGTKQVNKQLPQTTQAPQPQQKIVAKPSAAPQGKAAHKDTKPLVATDVDADDVDDDADSFDLDDDEDVGAVSDNVKHLTESNGATSVAKRGEITTTPAATSTAPPSVHPPTKSSGKLPAPTKVQPPGAKGPSKHAAHPPAAKAPPPPPPSSKSAVASTPKTSPAATPTSSKRPPALPAHPLSVANPLRSPGAGATSGLQQQLSVAPAVAVSPKKSGATAATKPSPATSPTPTPPQAPAVTLVEQRLKSSFPASAAASPLSPLTGPGGGAPGHSNEPPHQPMRRATTQAFMGHSDDPSHGGGSPAAFPTDGGVAGWMGTKATRTSLSFTEPTTADDGPGGGYVKGSHRSSSIMSLLSATSTEIGGSGGAGRGGGARGGGVEAPGQPFSSVIGRSSIGAAHLATSSGSKGFSFSANVGGTSALAGSHQRRQTGRVRLPSNAFGRSGNEGGDDDMGADLVFSRNVTSPTMSMASGVSRASSIASFRFRSAIAYDFLDDKKLRRDKHTEVILKRVAEDAVLAARKKKLSVVAADTSSTKPASNKGVGVPAPPPLQSAGVGVTVVPLTLGGVLPPPAAPVDKQQNHRRHQDDATKNGGEEMHHLFPITPGDDLCGPVLVVGDCGDDIIAVVMVLAMMEAYSVEEHNKLLSNIYSYVLASGSGVYIALALSQGETMNQLLEMLLQNDASFLRPPKPTKKATTTRDVPSTAQPSSSATKKAKGAISKSSAKSASSASVAVASSSINSAPYHEAFYDDGVDAIETLLRLKFAEGEKILEDSGNTPSSSAIGDVVVGGRLVSHRYRRGDYSVARPCLFLSNPAGDAVNIVDWNSDASSLPAMYAVAANCKVTIPSRQGQPHQQQGKVVSLLVDKLPDPMLFALTMTPRPTAVCRVSLPFVGDGAHERESSDAVAALRQRRQDLMAKEFRSDFIDIALPEFADLPPRGNPDDPNAATPPTSVSRIRRKSSWPPRHRGSISSSCSISAQGLPTDPNAGNLSCLTVGLDGITPMEDLLEEWNLEGAGKERRLAVIQQTEAFIEDIEGSLQRAMDYMVAKAPKPMQAAATAGTMMLDELFNMPNSVQ